MTEDVIDLQVKIAHLENFVEELNKVVIEQYTEINQLKKDVSVLKDKLEKGLSSDTNILNEKPPHY